MEVANSPAFYDMATTTAVKSFTVQALALHTVTVTRDINLKG
jgi:hypothetical protein